jgi:pimeloyl-ACP methyl ester carboxylesterase
MFGCWKQARGSPNAGPKRAPLVTRLPGFRFLALDRPGCGLSNPVDYSCLDLSTFAADLFCQVLDGLGLPRISVVAISLGGALALYFTHACPERVTRLIQEGCPVLVQGFRVPIYNLFSTLVSLLTGKSLPSLPAFRRMGHASSIN